jgi:hypothetical protein
MRNSNLGGNYLRLLLNKGEGKGIKIIGKILFIAILVGSCQAVEAQAAFAPKMELAKHPKLYAKIVTLGQWGSATGWKCLDDLWTHESHWNAQAKNPTSTAFGIPQFLDQTWIDYNFPLRPKNAIVQITAGLRYISVRYGTPCNAWKHEKQKGWY